MLSRRRLAWAPLLLAGCRKSVEEAPGWHWDQALLQAAAKAAEPRWDPKERLLQTLVPAGYKYHTRLRDQRAHPTRESLEYALVLFELGRPERALAILDRILALQVTDPASRFAGLWGWYAEEPPEKMGPADFNWADFLGASLLHIAVRHAPQLGAPRLARLRESIALAAATIRRRNVSMTYTNIAALGTFVTAAAAELLGDQELLAYSLDRILRLEAAGVCSEYNAPSFSRVTLAALARLRAFCRHEGIVATALRLEERLWHHLANHWDLYRQQFTGPMARAYSSDLGYPAWLEKALDRRLGLMRLDRRSGDDAEAALVPFRCPEALAARFLQPVPPRQHSEIYSSAPETIGTNWIDKDLSLGSVNRSDFWQQRRPLLGFFGDSARPARTIQLRVIKDGFDFASALFFSVQHERRVAGFVNFQNPGGNRHPDLDPISDGRFECGRLFLELDFEGLPENFTFTQTGDAVDFQSTLLAGHFHLLGARFGPWTPTLKATRGAQSLTITLDFKPPESPKLVVWEQIQDAFAAFTLNLGAPAPPAVLARSGSQATLSWDPLRLSGSTAVLSPALHQRAFQSSRG